MRRSASVGAPLMALWFAFLMCWLPTPSHAARIAVIAVGTNLGTWDRVMSAPRVKYEERYLRSLGYQVQYIVGTTDNIATALAEPQVRAISYFGHGTAASMETLNASGWKQRMYEHFLLQYRRQGMSQGDASQRATADVQNFGLELVRNHSCSSLANDSLARQFVRPGGAYHGVGGSYVPCPTPFLLMDNVSMVLQEYKVPGSLPTMPPQLRECERAAQAQEICGVWSWDGQRLSANWTNGARAMLNVDRFDESWVVISRADTEGASAGLTAIYRGRRTGNRVDGTVTWTWQGRSWSGRWSAAWGAPGARIPGQG
jgi:hypothetical protein